MEAALGQLPFRQSAVITLRDVDGYGAEEVCAVLGISAGNQRVLLHRARAAVRARLEEYFTGAAARQAGSDGMTWLDCNEFVELVTRYLDGQLDHETERRFTEHLAQCDGCDRYLDQFRQTVSTLGELRAESLSLQARDRLLSAFRDWRRP